jgi:signal transduction histidine kinase
VIQPYIGVELGLAALLRQAESAAEARDEGERAEILGALHARLRRLLEMTHGGVAELRGFLSRLRAGENRAGSFESILSSYVRRFTELTGIAVQLEISPAPELDANDRLSAEIFQLIAEGLSNVRRHADGKLALVHVAQSESALRVSIENDGRPGNGPPQWTPRSIADRARSLQGWTTVTERPEGGCAVTVEIPL